MKSTIKKLAAEVLTIDPNVQRVEGIDHGRVNRMAQDFKPHFLGVITVSQRDDDRLVVLDGMHRTELCRTVDHRGLLQCEVFTGLTIAEEAELFYFRNNGKMPSAISKFHARLLMCDPVAVDITIVLADHQWEVQLSNRPGCLAAVDAVERVYRNGGKTVPEGQHPDLLGRVIEVVTIAWEWDSKSVDASILLAVAQLVGRFGASIDTKKLVSEMQSTRPGVLIGKAKVLRDAQGGTVPAALAKILVGMHNKKRRSNLLPEWVWIR